MAGWGEISLQINFNFWIADFRTKGQVVDQINTAIYARFEREGVRMRDRLPEGVKV